MRQDGGEYIRNVRERENGGPNRSGQDSPCYCSGHSSRRARRKGEIVYRSRTGRCSHIGNRERCQRILEAADRVHYVSKDGYKPGCRDARDKWMLKNVSTVLAFVERRESGTGRAIEAALSLGRKVIAVDTRARTCAAVTSPA